MSILLERRTLAAELGQTFGGDRDMYDILGYPVTITMEQYWAKYRRQDIAGTIVDLPAIETWRRPPVIQDGDSDTEMESETGSAFVEAFKRLVTKRKVWHYLQRVDKLSGVGRYGVMLIGVRGTEALSQPIPTNLSGPEDVLYFSVFSEDKAVVKTFVEATNDERFGLPETYQVSLGSMSQVVHWSRCIHVAEGLLEDDVYGRPRLERVYNRLDDLEKITGGGAEATWKVMDKGLHADVRDGFNINNQSENDLSDEIEEYIHGLRRFIRTQGVNINDLGSEVVDPSGLFKIVISLISATTNIPQRKLSGSERGELASSQDEANWAGIVAARQTQFAEPQILRPLIDRLIYAGALPEPDNGDYQVTWPSLFEMDELEWAKVVDLIAGAVAKVAPPGATDLIIRPDEFRERYLRLPPQDEIDMLMAEESDGDSTAD